MVITENYASIIFVSSCIITNKLHMQQNVKYNISFRNWA